MRRSYRVSTGPSTSSSHLVAYDEYRIKGPLELRDIVLSQSDCGIMTVLAQCAVLCVIERPKEVPEGICDDLVTLSDILAERCEAVARHPILCPRRQSRFGGGGGCLRGPRGRRRRRRRLPMLVVLVVMVESRGGGASRTRTAGSEQCDNNEAPHPHIPHAQNIPLNRSC